MKKLISLFMILIILFPSFAHAFISNDIRNQGVMRNGGFQLRYGYSYEDLTHRELPYLIDNDEGTQEYVFPYGNTSYPANSQVIGFKGFPDNVTITGYFIVMPSGYSPEGLRIKFFDKNGNMIRDTGWTGENATKQNGEFVALAEPVHNVHGFYLYGFDIPYPQIIYEFDVSSYVPSQEGEDDGFDTEGSGDFLTEMWETITRGLGHIELAYASLNNITFEDAAILQYMGYFRYIVGDYMYVLLTIGFIVSLGIMIWKVILYGIDLIRKILPW